MNKKQYLKWKEIQVKNTNVFPTKASAAKAETLCQRVASDCQLGPHPDFIDECGDGESIKRRWK